MPFFKKFIVMILTLLQWTIWVSFWEVKTETWIAFFIWIEKRFCGVDVLPSLINVLMLVLRLKSLVYSSFCFNFVEFLSCNVSMYATLWFEMGLLLYVQPQRSQFCRQCNAWIDHFDHHCPAVMNCVGKIHMNSLAQSRSLRGWGKSSAFGFCLQVFLGAGKELEWCSVNQQLLSLSSVFLAFPFFL
jgi:hypothetical protein